MPQSSTEVCREIHPDQPAPASADARPIPGCPPGYFVTRDAKVFSSVHRRFWGKGWRAVAVGKDGKVRLPVLTDGRVVYRRRSVKTVARAAFGGAA